MTRRHRLVLWDVDHTLIENGGVSKDTYAGAFELLTGQLAQGPPDTEGRTDLAIMKAMVAAHNLAWTYDADYQSALARSLEGRESDLRHRGFALPGARAALSTLDAVDGLHGSIHQSVLTSNVRPNAERKLAAFGLSEHLDFAIGGFGSDSADRADLVPIAQGRARSSLGMSFGREDTVLVGDTPRDVAAGREGGARVIGVASGVYSVEDLKEAGADVVLPDLTDTTLVVEAVLAATDVEGAVPERMAESLLWPLGDRWLHTQAVAARARELAAAVPPDDRSVLVQAAWLHDLGYAPALAESGLHALDGARWLQLRGIASRVCALVAHHSGALVEARHRGLDPIPFS